MLGKELACGLGAKKEGDVVFVFSADPPTDRVQTQLLLSE